MISMKESLIGGSTLNGVSESVSDNWVLETDYNASRKVVLGPIRKPSLLRKSVIEALGLCATAATASSTEKVQEFKVIRQSEQIADIKAIFAPSGQIRTPSVLANREYRSSSIRTVGDIDIHAAYRDDLGNSLPVTRRVGLSAKQTSVARSTVTVNDNPGSLNASTWKNFNVAIFRVSDGKFGSRLTSVHSVYPLGWYNVNTTALTTTDDGIGIVGTIPQGTTLEIATATYLNGSWRLAANQITHTITSTGAVRVGNGSTELTLGSVTIPKTTALVFREQGSSDWRLLERPSPSSSFPLVSSMTAGVVTVLQPAPATVNVTDVEGVSINIQVGRNEEGIDGSDLGWVAYYTVDGVDNVVLDSTISQSVIGMSSVAKSVGLTDTTLEFTIDGNPVSTIRSEVLPVDTIYSATEQVALNISVPKNNFAVGIRVWATFRSGGWKPGSASFNTPYVIYEGSADSFVWTGSTIRQEAIPTVNTTDNYPPTYTGRLELNINAGGDELQLEEGDVIIYDSGSSNAVVANFPVTVTG